MCMSGAPQHQPSPHCDCPFKNMHLQPFSALCVGWISTGLVLSETRVSVGSEDDEAKKKEEKKTPNTPGIIGSPSQTATSSARHFVAGRTCNFQVCGEHSGGCSRSNEDERGWGCDDGWRLECWLGFFFPPPPSPLLF